MWNFNRAALVAIAAVIAVPGVFALGIGETIEGELTDTDPLGAEQSHEDLITLSLTAGVSTAIELISEDFDAYLRVELPDGTQVEDDDGLTRPHSRVVVTSSTDQDVTVCVTSFSAWETGDYTLTIRLADAQELVLGETITGVSNMDRGEKYLLPLEPGQLVEVVVEAEGEMIMVMASLPGGGQVHDSAYEGGSVSVHLLASQAGAASITTGVYSQSGGQSEFTLTTRLVEPDATLTLTDEPMVTMTSDLSSVETAQLIMIEAPAGQRIQVELNSWDFDAILKVIAGGEALENDDAGMGTNSRLRLFVPESGQVMAIAKSFSGAAEGTFVMNVRPIESDTVPPFTLPDLEGNPVNLSEFDGQIRIIDFWATWCPPCVMEIPHFIELADEYADQGVAIIGIATWERDESVLPGFIEEQGINYPILVDNGMVSQAFGMLTDEGQMTGIPTTFVVDEEGTIHSVHTGYTDKEVFVDEIEALLARGE